LAGRTASLFLLLGVLSSGCGSDERLSVLLVILDTVPASHVGYCGYGRDTTPMLDSLAGSGAAFLDCQAQSPWTLPSCVTVVSGLNVRSHGARRYEDQTVMGIGLDLPTLQTVLNDLGYCTGGFTNSYMLGQYFGWHRGFDRFHCEQLGYNNAAPTIDSCLTWLDGLDGQPFFALVHFFDPHDPYTPPAPWDTLFGTGGEPFNWNTRTDYEPPDPSLREHLIDLYDGSLAFTDDQLGRLLAGLRERGLADNTLVVVVADHGEEFLEHGQIWHGKTLFQEVLHVPLVIAGPGVPVGEVSRLVAQSDIVPTLAALLEIPWPGRLDGTDLFREPREGLPVFSCNLNATPLQVASVRIGNMKTLWEALSDSSFSFDLSSDPEETQPLPADSTGLEQIHLYWATPCACEPLAVDRDNVDRALHDLGYI
jgi:arylsulfatase A-like enzyme